MSCWREQHVLRMPATTIGIYTKEGWEEFYSKLSYKNGPMIDYILVDSAPVEGGGYKMSARLLWYNEEMEYLPIFQKEFPGFTLEQMDEVHYCEYKWYDATEAPYCY